MAISRGGVSAQVGVCRGSVCQGDVCQRGCQPRGCIPACIGADTSPVDRMTDACEKITFPQLLLWMVNIRIRKYPTSAETPMWGTASFHHAGHNNKSLAGVTQEVNLRECISHMPLSSANKASHSGFETQKICHKSPKQRYQ